MFEPKRLVGHAANLCRVSFIEVDISENCVVNTKRNTKTHVLLLNDDETMSIRISTKNHRSRTRKSQTRNNNVINAGIQLAILR